jgi:cytoplasmic iron level regulating protein YaaA (DUF328/UPF0246 family)
MTSKASAGPALPLILLAPSEDKAPGGRLGTLAESPAQRWVRDQLVDLVVHGSPEAQRRAFDVKDAALAKAREEALALRHRIPLLPALERYAGVAFQALDAASLDPGLRRQVFILSNLRGLVRGDEPIPPYKLMLAGLPGLRGHWQRHLRPDLEALPPGTLWELLPQDSAALLKGWTRPRHTLEILDPQGRAISHWSKLYRGRVARWILEHGQGDPAKVRRSRIEDAAWDGSADNGLGGRCLRLVVTAQAAGRKAGAAR